MTFRPPSRWQWFKADLYALFNPSEQCIHRSHRLGLKCRRAWNYDHMCGVHAYCSIRCPRLDKETSR